MNIRELNAQMRKDYHAAGYTGKNIVFAVLDTGVEPVGRLRGKVAHRHGTEPRTGHGTFTASVINEYCPDAEIWSYRCDYPSDIISALNDVTAQVAVTGKRIIVNMSLETDAEYIRDAVDSCVAAGIPLVCAAGNDGEEVLNKYPTCFESPITVAALQADGKRAYFSTWHGEVDFSDFGQWVDGLDVNGNTVTKSGTSFASPQVAGKIGLLLSANPNMTEPEVYEALKGMAVDLDRKGRDPMTGYGFVQLSEPTQKEEPKEEPVGERILKLIDKPRMSGDDVKELQTLLDKHGFPCGEIDGIFGPATDKAVKSFQKANGLTVDGKVGEKTWAALRALPEPNTPVDPGEPTKLEIGLVQHCYEHLGDIYGWGGNGQKFDTTADADAWLRRNDDAGNPERSIRFMHKQIEAGVTDLAVFDCSGLISRYLQDIGVVSSKRNCDHLWAMCTRVTRAELRPGDLLFRSRNGDMYHVGVYVGRGRIIEAKGRDDGVVLRGIDASGAGYWNKFGRLNALQK